MNMNRASVRLIYGFLLGGLLLSACSTGGDLNPPPEASESVSSPEPVATIEPSPSPEPAAGLISGLTGLPVTGETALPRPLSIMINNAPAARPQSGISEADILYEVLAEGGITRLIGVFQSHTGVVKIGPIRSIRPYLIDIGESHGAVTVHAGGSPDAYAILQRQKKEDMDEIGRAGAYFWRDKERKAPHNLYSNTARLWEGAAKLGFAKNKEVPGYTFATADSIPGGGTAAPEFRVNFLLKSYEVSYHYNAERGTYVRSVNGKPHLDLNNNQPIEAANVIVMSTGHKVLDDVGRLQVDVELGGEAVLFQRGEAVHGRWVRKLGDIIRFVKDGKEAPMIPGVTHILIVPKAPSFSSHLHYPGTEKAT